MNLFTREYYEDGKRMGLSCYENYRWMPDLTIPMAKALVENLGIEKEDTILDFGCAKGYLVKAFIHLGHRAAGIDISDYAIGQADADVAPYLSCGTHFNGPFTWIICKDVLEHIEEHELLPLLQKMRAESLNLFIAVPLGNNGMFTIPEMEMDVTHKVRRPLWWWTSIVEEAGFKNVRSSFSMRGVKENWRRWQFGNGFIVAS